MTMETKFDTQGEDSSPRVVVPVRLVIRTLSPNSPGQVKRELESWNREELHREVWACPLVRVATKYGISAVALGIS
jgi:hypothetical protein